MYTFQMDRLLRRALFYVPVNLNFVRFVVNLPCAVDAKAIFSAVKVVNLKAFGKTIVKR